jgi:polyisoprenoid-binding protein YceI
MKNIFPILAAVALMSLISCGAEDDANTDESTSGIASAEMSIYTVDKKQSRIKWQGGMIGGYGHEGTLNVSEGSFSVAGNEVVSGTITLDMNSIMAADANYNPDAGQTKEALLSDFRSPDFFDVENHPTATFTITTAGNGSAGGDLTIRGVSNYVKIAKLSVKALEDGISVGGTFTFNRQDFGVSFENTMSDYVLSNDVVVTFRVIGH